MFTLSGEALRTIRTRDLRQSEDELGARLYRTRNGGDAIRAFEAGRRAIPPLVAAAIVGFQAADLVARGLDASGGSPAIPA